MGRVAIPHKGQPRRACQTHEHRPWVPPAGQLAYRNSGKHVAAPPAGPVRYDVGNCGYRLIDGAMPPLRFPGSSHRSCRMPRMTITISLQRLPSAARFHMLIASCLQQGISTSYYPPLPRPSRLSSAYARPKFVPRRAMHQWCVADANGGEEAAGGWWRTWPSCRWGGRSITPASWPPTTKRTCLATVSPQAGGTAPAPPAWGCRRSIRRRVPGHVRGSGP